MSRSMHCPTCGGYKSPAFPLCIGCSLMKREGRLR